MTTYAQGLLSHPVHLRTLQDDLVDFLQRIRKAYVEGLCWVLVYYYQACRLCFKACMHLPITATVDRAARPGPGSILITMRGLAKRRLTWASACCKFGNEAWHGAAPIISFQDRSALPCCHGDRVGPFSGAPATTCH